MRGKILTQWQRTTELLVWTFTDNHDGGLTFAIPSGELDLQLTSVESLSVQIEHGVLCVPRVLKPDLVKALERSTFQLTFVKLRREKAQNYTIIRHCTIQNTSHHGSTFCFWRSCNDCFYSTYGRFGVFQMLKWYITFINRILLLNWLSASNCQTSVSTFSFTHSCHSRPISCLTLARTLSTWPWSWVSLPLPRLVLLLLGFFTQRDLSWISWPKCFSFLVLMWSQSLVATWTLVCVF